MTGKITRMSLDQIRKLRGLSNARKVSEMTDDEINSIIDADPDLYHLTDEELAEFEIPRNKTHDKGNS